MFVRAYLRASTDDQDAGRARPALTAFAVEHGHRIAAWYIENASGTQASRPELERLLRDAHRGDVLLIEQVDRLTRLTRSDWERLKHAIETAGVRVVALDLPTSYLALQATGADDFMGRLLDALNAMLIDVLAAVARKDYDDRRRRQAEGIAKARAAGVYQGRPADAARHARVRELRAAGLSLARIAEHTGYSRSQVCRILAQPVV